MADVQVICFQCHTELVFADQVGFRAECTKCHADAHVCKNCIHYDPKVYNECKEPSADKVRDRDRANYCEYFKPRSSASSEAPGKAKTDLLSAAEALFKKK
ncbi:MAG: hypothetical protein AB7F59_14850 [Bdellovibrionales bacterium]